MEDSNNSIKTFRYTTEEVEKIIMNSNNHCILLTHYIDHIKNYRSLTEEMLEIIKTFDDSSKMQLIEQFNNSIKTICSLLD